MECRCGESRVVGDTRPSKAKSPVNKGGRGCSPGGSPSTAWLDALRNHRQTRCADSRDGVAGMVWMWGVVKGWE